MASCDAATTNGATLTVTSLQSSGQANGAPSTFRLDIPGTPGPQPRVSCSSIASSPEIFPRNGVRHRDAFDRKFTRILAVSQDVSTQNSVFGWLSTTGEFQSMSSKTTEEDLVSKNDENPMYHDASERIFFWRVVKDKHVMKSCRPDGSELRDEGELAKKYDFEGLSTVGMGGHGTSQVHMPSTAAPVITESRVINKAGTLSANITTTPGIRVASPVELGKSDSSTDGSLPFSGDIPIGSITPPTIPVAFVTDKVLMLLQGKQLYRVDISDGKAAKTTLMFENDKLEIADVMSSPDGGTIAFLGHRDRQVALYTVPSTGGSPTKVKVFDHSAAILDYS
ncbi:hypothetical protein ABT256_34230 [Amycolatopsis japonica]|uniref:hypothetical protein n=1 Tax=Amycolatopsis japonica TaxID=208439 RepID=UPI003321F797